MVKLKAGLLVILVATSVVLSALIIYGQPSPSNSVEDPGQWFGPKPGLNELCLPGRIYICNNFGEVAQVETFSQMYTDLVLTLGQIEYGSEKSGNVWVTSEFNRNSVGPGVMFRFDYLVSRELLANWLTLFYETDFPFAFIDEIIVPMDGGPIRFVNTTTGVAWARQADLPREVLELAAMEPRDVLFYPLQAMEDGGAYSVVPGVFDLEGEQVFVVPAFSLAKVEEEEIIRSFFANPSIIKEADGTRTYTDGYDALRVFPLGALEYTGVGGEQDGFLNQTRLLQGSIDFLHLHGGWPNSMLPVLLHNLPTAPSKLEFARFGGGLPICGEDLGIFVEFQGEQVSFLRLQLPEVNFKESTEETVRPLTALLSGETQIASYFSVGDKTIRDATIVYYAQGMQLLPAWRLKTEDQLLYLGAADGRIIEVRDLLGGE